MSDNTFQKSKKNKSRPKVSQLGLVPSIQLKSYKKIKLVKDNQNKLF
jgi:hypothetical protein